MTNSQKVVTPAKTEVQCSFNHLIFLYTDFRRYDVYGEFRLFAKTSGLIGKCTLGENIAWGSFVAHLWQKAPDVH